MERLVNIYGDRIYRLALGITGNPQDAAEVVQHALWTLLRKSDTGPAKRARGTWVYRLVVNRAYRKLHREPDQSAEIPLEDVLPPLQEDGRHAGGILDWSTSVDAVSLGTDLRSVLLATIGELPAHYRSVLLLRDVEGLSNAETAQALRIAVAKVKLRVHRARLFLRKQLAIHFSARRVDKALTPLSIPWAF